MRNEKFYNRLNEEQSRIAYAVDLIKIENKLGNKNINTIKELRDYMTKRESAHLVARFYGYPNADELIEAHTEINRLEIEELLDKHPEMIPVEWRNKKEDEQHDI